MPFEITNLSNLENLNLSNNCITVICRDIGKFFPQLADFNLENNNIKNSPDLNSFNSRVDINITDNPLKLTDEERNMITRFANADHSIFYSEPLVNKKQKLEEKDSTSTSSSSSSSGEPSLLQEPLMLVDPLSISSSLAPTALPPLVCCPPPPKAQKGRRIKSYFRRSMTSLSARINSGRSDEKYFKKTHRFHPV